MLKFFRKIRQNLLAEGKSIKYLKYAIGEIVLVVIGILIALQVNNWNEQRKTEAKVESIFVDIMDELTSDIEKTTFIMHYYARKDSIIYLIQNNRITFEDYKKNNIPFLWSLTGWYSSVDLTKEAYNNLINYKDAIPSKYDSILKDLSQLYNSLQETVIRHNKDMAELVNENINIAMRNYPWFASNSESDIEKQLDYMVNDFRYKNEVEGYRNKGINNQLRWAVIYRQNAIECYKKIAKLLNKSTEHEIFTFSQDIANILIGEWYVEGSEPKEIISFFVKDNRVFGKNTEGDTWEVFYLSHFNKLMDTDLDYASIVKVNNETILKFNGFELKKVIPNND